MAWLVMQNGGLVNLDSVETVWVDRSEHGEGGFVMAQIRQLQLTLFVGPMLECGAVLNWVRHRLEDRNEVIADLVSEHAIFAEKQGGEG